MEKLLQDENLSYSYLVRTLDSEPPFENGPLFVLKRIYCPFGDIESVSAAMNEISYYKKFAGNSHIISCLDYQLHQKYDGSKQIDVLFPFYHYGSVQDDINRHLLSSSTALGTVIPEKDCIKIMIGLCRGLLPLHDPKLREQGSPDDMAIMSYSENAPLLLNDLPMELSKDNENENVCFAYYNLRPDLILLSEQGNAIIADLQSCFRTNITISTEIQLNRFQQWIEEHCTLQFSAPELLTLKMGDKITAKVDIWSLGCVLYSMMFGISPFEREEQLNGGVVKYCIKMGKYSIPDTKGTYSQEIIDILNTCLKVDPSERPSLNGILNNLQEIQGKLSQ